MSQKLSSYTSGHLEVSESAACLEKASFSYTSGHVEVLENLLLILSSLKFPYLIGGDGVGDDIRQMDLELDLDLMVFDVVIVGCCRYLYFAGKDGYSTGTLKKHFRILRVDVITTAFALRNYIRNNDKEDTVYITFKEHPDYLGGDELRDGLGANNDDNFSRTSNEMKQIRNDIATSI
ncbi:hypothetical protein Tco_0659782 [Tanacetum coccineum]